MQQSLMCPKHSHNGGYGRCRISIHGEVEHVVWDFNEVPAFVEELPTNAKNFPLSSGWVATKLLSQQKGWRYSQEQLAKNQEYSGRNQMLLSPWFHNVIFNCLCCHIICCIGMVVFEWLEQGSNITISWILGGAIKQSFLLSSSGPCTDRGGTEPWDYPGLFMAMEDNGLWWNWIVC